MQFLTTLLGGSENTLLNSAFALGIVLVLIVLGVWVLKLFTRAGTTMARGRNRRVAVVESTMVDSRRQLLIVRRDNVEHLILTGGPQDLVIESGIPAAEAAPRQQRRPQAEEQPAAAAQPAPEAQEIATPIVPERKVSRDTVDRLHDLVRPDTVRPRQALRHTALLRPVSVQDTVIPMPPDRRADNSRGAPTDSATSGPSSGTGGRAGLGNDRVFRSVINGERN